MTNPATAVDAPPEAGSTIRAHRAGRRRTATAAVVLALALLSSGVRSARAQEAVDPDRLNAAVRAAVEPQYRERTGGGFEWFRCDSQAPLRPGGFLDCDAGVANGRSLHLVLAIDDGGHAEVVLTSQLASSLDADERAELETIEPPCRTFLEAWAAGDWDAAYATLSPAAQKDIGREAFGAGLGKMREALGPVRSSALRRFASRSPAGTELEYALECENGPGVARFRIETGAGASGLLAYRVGPAVGSPIDAKLLEAAFGDHVASILGRPVAGLEVRLDALTRVGEAVEGRALLSDGGESPIRLELIRRFDDFDTSNYGLQLLDAPFLIERHLTGRSQPVEKVECPTRVVPDGGSEVCEALLPGGARLAMTIARQGGDHRLSNTRSIPEASSDDLGALAAPENEEPLVLQLGESMKELTGDARLESVRKTVRSVRSKLAGLDAKSISGLGPGLAGLNLGAPGDPLLDSTLRHLACGVALTLRMAELDGGQDSPSRLEAAGALVAHSAAAAFVSARFGERGGRREELEAFISSEAATGAAAMLQENPALVESASAECLAAAAALVN